MSTEGRGGRKPQTQSAVEATKRMEVERLREDLTHHMRYTLGISERNSTPLALYEAFSLAIRDRVIDRWVATQDAYIERNPKELYYLSLEFLIGRLLSNNIINLGIEDI
ncbi:MAG: hypothetical protein IJJ33_08015, partial [Victivallales bacterium]|nr:hypothetical protein [Victivallales bacterium]